MTYFKKFLLTSLASIILFPTLALSIGYTHWQENGVPVHEGTGALKPAIVSDNEGGGIVFWADTRFAPFLSIYAQRVDSGGNLVWGSEVRVKDSVGAMTFGDIKAVSDGSGGGIVVWPYGMEEYDIYGGRVTSSGEVLWVGRVSGVGTADFFPVAVSDGYRGVVVAWVQAAPGGYDVYVQRVSGNGTKLWGNGINVSNSGQAYFYYPEIISFQDDLGNFYYSVAWAQHTGDYYGFYAQLLTPSGQILWGSGGKVIFDSGGGYITPLSGEILAVQNSSRSGDWDIYIQLVDVYGNFKWDSCGLLLVDLPRDEAAWGVISESGRAYIVYQADSGGYHNLYVQAVDTTGVGLWGDAGVYVGIRADTSTSMVGVSPPVMVPDYEGGVIIAWQAMLDSTWDIYAQHVNSSGDALWGEYGLPVCTAQGIQEMPSITTDQQNGAIIVWTDIRGAPHNGAYAQRVSDYPPGEVSEGPSPQNNLNFNIYQSGENIKITFNLREPSFTKISAFDVTGRLIAPILSQRLDAGLHTLIWNMKDQKNRSLSTGIYFIRMETRGFKKTRKVLFLR